MGRGPLRGRGHPFPGAPTLAAAGYPTRGEIGAFPMAKIKINPLLLLLSGLLLIVAAVIGLFGGLFSSQGGEEKAASSPEPTSRLQVNATASSPDGEVLKKRQPRLQQEKKEKKKDVPSAEEDEAEMTQILLEQIRRSPDTLDLEWIASFAQFVNDEDSFRRYLDEINSKGLKRYESYLRRLERNGLAPTSNPYFFLEEAKRTRFSRKGAAKKMEKHGLEWLAAAYYKEQMTKGGWAAVDEGFMTAFFEQSLRLYTALVDSARVRGGRLTTQWQEELIRAHEVRLMDCYLRIKSLRRNALEPLANTSDSAAVAQLNQDRMQRQINTSLLALGQYYLHEAVNESSDIRRLRYHAEHTFQAMAMAYQLKPSDEALAALRKVNEVQRLYLYRMALVDWKKAREAVDESDVDQADNLYFNANKHFLQCMSRWEEGKREAHEVEFRRLKQEIAAWQLKKRTDAAASSG